MCWRFLRNFWAYLLFPWGGSSGDRDRAADAGLDGPGSEKAKGIGVGGGREA